MSKRSAHHFLVVLLTIFTLAGAAGIVLWQHQGLKFYSISDSSLAPTLLKGDMVVLSQRRVAGLGDIAGYTNPADARQIIPRRVTGSNDGNEVGKVIKSLPLAGYLLDLIRRPAGLALLVYVPAFMILRAEAKRLNRHLGRQPYVANGFTPVSQHSNL